MFSTTISILENIGELNNCRGIEQDWCIKVVMPVGSSINMARQAEMAGKGQAFRNRGFACESDSRESTVVGDSEKWGLLLWSGYRCLL